MTRYVSDPLRTEVRGRASFRCEYCGVHEDDTYLAHELDHVIAEKHGGLPTLENLALACFFCNRHKGSDIASIDPVSGDLTPLFNPRTQDWNEHFRLQGPRIVPKTPEGRVSVRVLQLNEQERLVERQTLIRAGRYPVAQK